MTVATYTRPNYSTQAGTTYPSNIDAMAAVFERLAAAFAPHEQNAGSPAPDLTIVVDAGAILDASGATPDLNERAQQTVTGFTVPSAGQTRIDRVVLHETTGDAIRVAGTAVTTGGSPSAAAPAIPAGYLPCCRMQIADTDTAITNDMITDERAGFPVKTAASKKFESAAQTITAAGALTIAHGLGAEPLLVQVVLACVTGELGYTAGDHLVLTPGDMGSGPNRGVSVVPDGTNLNLRFGSDANTFSLLRKDTGALANATNANWSLIVRAWL